jgi:hypothetical protein
MEIDQTKLEYPDCESPRDSSMDTDEHEITHDEDERLIIDMEDSPICEMEVTENQNLDEAYIDNKIEETKIYDVIHANHVSQQEAEEVVSACHLAQNESEEVISACHVINQAPYINNVHVLHEETEQNDSISYVTHNEKEDGMNACHVAHQDSEEVVSAGHVAHQDTEEVVSACHVAHQDTEEVVSACHVVHQNSEEVVSACHVAHQDSEEVVSACHVTHQDSEKKIVSACHVARQDTEEVVGVCHSAHQDSEEVVSACHEAHQDTEEVVSACHVAHQDTEEVVSVCHSAHSDSEKVVSACHLAQQDSEEVVSACHVAHQDIEEVQSACHVAQHDTEEVVSACRVAHQDSEEVVSACHVAHQDSEEVMSGCHEAHQDTEEVLSACHVGHQDSEEDVSACHVAHQDPEEVVSACHVALQESKEVVSAKAKADVVIAVNSKNKTDQNVFGNVNDPNIMSFFSSFKRCGMQNVFPERPLLPGLPYNKLHTTGNFNLLNRMPPFHRGIPSVYPLKSLPILSNKLGHAANQAVVPLVVEEKQDEEYSKRKKHIMIKKSTVLPKIKPLGNKPIGIHNVITKSGKRKVMALKYMAVSRVPASQQRNEFWKIVKEMGGRVVHVDKYKEKLTHEESSNLPKTLDNFQDPVRNHLQKIWTSMTAKEGDDVAIKSNSTINEALNESVVDIKSNNGYQNNNVNIESKHTAQNFTRISDEDDSAGKKEPLPPIAYSPISAASDDDSNTANKYFAGPNWLRSEVSSSSGCAPGDEVVRMLWRNEETEDSMNNSYEDKVNITIYI